MEPHKNITSFGIEMAAPLGIDKCARYHLRLTRVFCERAGLEVSNWSDVITRLPR
jgi:hypothetical protein